MFVTSTPEWMPTGALTAETLSGTA